AELERSYLRIYASSSEGLFNDVLVPLNRGNVVMSADRLTRHDPHTQVLYSLMIDRFYDGNKKNNQPLNREDVRPEVDYQGGDLKGITQKIEQGFFNKLGISTIWISPITQNPRDAWGLNQEPFTRFSGYHGYWPIYSTVIDDRFGSPEELRELLDVAHDNGLNVILDYVANHLHINSPVLQEHPDWVTELMLPDGRKNLGLWDEQRLTTWFDEHIPSLDHERVEVVEPMTDSALYWVTEYEFDGFRHDACKHIPLGYWRTLTKKMRTRVTDRELWQIGETYGSPELIGSYVCSGMINAQFDFNVYHTALDVLTRDASVKRLADVVEQSIGAYGAHHTMGNITGNHDKGRLISLAGGALHPDEDHKLAGWTRKIEVGDPIGYKKLALINALNMTIPGVPCIYQGDEYGEPGGNDPDNRRMMRFDGYNEAEQAQLATTRKLAELRREQMPLLYGDQLTLRLTDSVWAYLRIYMGEWTVVALNTGYETEQVEFVLPTGINLKQPLKPNFGATYRLEEDGKMTIELKPCGFEILTKK
ncbi:MAG: alpha-amylase family glycosyl hydrolase, partial [Rikenellaceae bacterium]|nr:alpha-amylase family glycosyl hydrolase [Rikenellaceae bacterium]